MSPIIEGARAVGRGLSMGEEKSCFATYDFAIDGGAAGTIALRGDSMPSGAVIIDTLIVLDTPCTGGTVTDTLSIGTGEGGSQVDVQPASARNASPWSTATPKRGGVTATAAPVQLTAKRSLTFYINGTSLTAGKFRVIVTYWDF